MAPFFIRKNQDSFKNKTKLIWKKKFKVGRKKPNKEGISGINKRKNVSISHTFCKKKSKIFNLMKRESKIVLLNLDNKKPRESHNTLSSVNVQNQCNNKLIPTFAKYSIIDSTNSYNIRRCDSRVVISIDLHHFKRHWENRNVNHLLLQCLRDKMCLDSKEKFDQLLSMLNTSTSGGKFNFYLNTSSNLNEFCGEDYYAKNIDVAQNINQFANILYFFASRENNLLSLPNNEVGAVSDLLSSNVDANNCTTSSNDGTSESFILTYDKVHKRDTTCIKIVDDESPKIFEEQESTQSQSSFTKFSPDDLFYLDQLRCLRDDQSASSTPSKETVYEGVGENSFEEVASLKKSVKQRELHSQSNIRAQVKFQIFQECDPDGNGFVKIDTLKNKLKRYFFKYSDNFELIDSDKLLDSLFKTLVDADVVDFETFFELLFDSWSEELKEFDSRRDAASAIDQQGGHFAVDESAATTSTNTALTFDDYRQFPSRDRSSFVDHLLPLNASKYRRSTLSSVGQAFDVIPGDIKEDFLSPIKPPRSHPTLSGVRSLNTEDDDCFNFTVGSFETNNCDSTIDALLLQQELTDLTSVNHRLLNENQEMTKRVSLFEAHQMELRETVSKLEEKLQQKEEQIMLLKATHLEEKKGLQGQVEQQQDEMKALEHSLFLYEREKEHLLRQIEAAQEDLNFYDEQIQNLMNDKMKFEEDVQKYEYQCRNFEREIVDAKEKVFVKDSLVLDLKRDVGQLEETVQALQTENVNLKCLWRERKKENLLRGKAFSLSNEMFPSEEDCETCLSLPIDFCSISNNNNDNDDAPFLDYTKNINEEIRLVQQRSASEMSLPFCEMSNSGSNNSSPAPKCLSLSQTEKEMELSPHSMVIKRKRSRSGDSAAGASSSHCSSSTYCDCSSKGSSPCRTINININYSSDKCDSCAANFNQSMGDGEKGATKSQSRVIGNRDKNPVGCSTTIGDFDGKASIPLILVDEPSSSPLDHCGDKLDTRDSSLLNVTNASCLSSSGSFDQSVERDRSLNETVVENSAPLRWKREEKEEDSLKMTNLNLEVEKLVMEVKQENSDDLPPSRGGQSPIVDARSCEHRLPFGQKLVILILLFTLLVLLFIDAAFLIAFRMSQSGISSYGCVNYDAAAISFSPFSFKVIGSPPI